MSSRPLHAVLLPRQQAGGRLLDALAAALDGTGPAILPLDPALPRARIDELVAAFGPTSIETVAGEMTRLSGPGRDGPRGEGHGAGVPDDVAVVLATSGSTGAPKGAELTAAALLASARASLARLGAARGDRWLCCLPTHHIAGLGVLVRSLVAGTTPLVLDRVDAGLPAGQASFVSLVPTQLRRLLDAGAPLDGFRTILLGGAAIQDSLLARAAAAGATVVTTYGMTETCGGCVYDGVPLSGVRVAADPGGRIRIAGPVLFSRYRLAPGLTAAALRDGWFVTSDLGGIAADGRLILRGRADDVIVTGGEKVAAGEIEQVLRAWPRVLDAAVAGAPDPDWGERVVAVIVAADPAAPPSADEVRAYVRGALARYAAPREVVLVGELPMLTSGKPDRQRIRAIAAGSHPGSGPDRNDSPVR